MNLPDHYRNNDLAPHGQNGLQLPSASAAYHEDRLDLRMLFSIFRRQMRMFWLIVAIFAGLALNYTFLQPKLYQATASVVMNKQRGDIVPETGNPRDDAPPRAEEVDTELKIIQSRQLADTVINAMRLDHDPELVAAAIEGTGLLARIRTMLGIAPAKADPATLRRKIEDLLLANLAVERMQTAYAMQISYTDSDPVQAAAITNGFATAYSASAANAKQADNRRTLDLLHSRIDELRHQAQADFQAVQDYRVRTRLLSAQATQLSEQETTAYGQQLAAARAGAASDRGRMSAANGEVRAAMVNSPVLQSLRSQRAVISVRVAEMAGRYLDKHPELVNARHELDNIDAQIAAETVRIRSDVTAGLVASASASAQQVGALQGNLASARATLAANNRALVGLDDLSRKAQASQALYESYLNRYKEVLAQTGTERPEARILSTAQVPGRPVSPNLMLNLALGLLLGSLVGAGAAIAVESSYSGLTTRDDVLQRLGMRCLGGIPQLSSIELGHMTPLQSLVEAPGSVYAEAVRGLLASIKQSGASRNQVIAVTSALPGEGKSSLAGSLARVAASGQSVILIDCDLVRRKQSIMLGVDNSRPGLREMMRDGVRLGDVMVKDTHSDAMIVPITTPFPDGERLLEHGNFQKMIAMLREHFSLIVLDLAPILPIAEVREIVTLADNVVVCAQWRKTPDTAAKAALQLLPLHAIGDIGVALTHIDMKKQARFGAGDPAYFYNQYRQYYAEPGPA